MRETNYEKFLTLKDWAEENKVKMGFGVICNTLEKENEDYYNALKAMDDSEYVEIWCHGYTHIQTGDSESGYNAEFTAPLSEQTETLKKCADILYDKCGITLRSLGVPHNLKNDDTAKALEAVPQFKTLIASGSPISGKTFLHLTNLIKFESGTGVIAPLDDIKNYLSKCGSYEYIMFQGHAPYWNENNRDDFTTVVQLLEYLKGEDIKFLTPTEYYNFVN